jgi:hypothetical protein
MLMAFDEVLKQIERTMDSRRTERPQNSKDFVFRACLLIARKDMDIFP